MYVTYIVNLGLVWYVFSQVAEMIIKSNCWRESLRNLSHDEQPKTTPFTRFIRNFTCRDQQADTVPPGENQQPREVETAPSGNQQAGTTLKSRFIQYMAGDDKEAGKHTETTPLRRLIRSMPGMYVYM